MDEREKDVAIAKAMGIEVVDWYYHHDPEYGGLDDLMCNDDGTPNWFEHCQSLSKILRETAIIEPSVRISMTRHDGSKYHIHEPIPHYDTPEGSWKILDYVRENRDEAFTVRFLGELKDHLVCRALTDDWIDPFCLAVTGITPALIKQAAFEAAKEDAN